ncbi:MAG: hypothetical protein KGY99_03195 [Phycisphaerae bacterium]|nr:hypothetical protein [Phycisphaerae bacterium]
MLVIVLLAAGLLVGLVFYVYNAGAQVSRRVEMQNAADAVAVSGGGWLARSFNVVAMNNVTQSRMVALVPSLDAIPQSANMAFGELNDWIGDDAYPEAPRAPGGGLDEIADQLSRPVPDLDAGTKQKVRKGVESLLKRLREQRELLAPFRSRSEGGVIDWAGITTWSVRDAAHGEPHGKLWRAARVLDEFNQATVDSAGTLAQSNAVRFGEDNGAQVALLVPVMPEMPAERGELQDFEPVLRKRLRVDLRKQKAREQNTSDIGGSIPNYAWPHRLGPWARLFDPPVWYRRRTNWSRRGWRRVWGVRVPTGPPRTRRVSPREGWRIQGPSARGGRAGRGASRHRGARRGGVHTWRPHTTIPHGYTTFGPYFWATKWIKDLASHRLRDCRFREYYEKISDTKLEYMFAASVDTLKTLHRPWWVTDLPTARDYGDDPTIRKSYTKYYYLEIIYEGDGPNRRVTSDNLHDPVARDLGGWVAPEDLRRRFFGNQPDVSEMEQVGDLPMFKFTAEGIRQRLSPDGEVVDEWPVYFEWYFIFGGLDCGGDTVITNPCNWDSDDQVPAPMLLTDTAREGYGPDPDVGARRAYFSVLGVVKDDGPEPFWQPRFASDNPLESMVTVSQAKVFNNQSWDLWTQDWQVQLTPVRQWGRWANRLHEGLVHTERPDSMINTAEAEAIRDYMRRLDGVLTEMYLTH